MKWHFEIIFLNSPLTWVVPNKRP